MYTVGPDYAHAEARKSPALDGKVERDEHGKEVRFPVLLSAKEKMLARRVSLAFKVSQQVLKGLRCTIPHNDYIDFCLIDNWLNFHEIILLVFKITHKFSIYWDKVWQKWPLYLKLLWKENESFHSSEIYICQE